MTRRGRLRIDPSWDQEVIDLSVRFNEVDSMKVVWHGHYVAYCESAREAFMAQRGLSYRAMDHHDTPAPVARMVLDYLHPARGGEVLTAICAHRPGGEPKLELVYEIRNPAGRLLCVAESLQVFVDGEGQVFMSAPPMVEAFFAETARRRAVRVP
jgi:acyl-CoA thioester hydrolase